jgi:hypothetical protein
MGTPGSEPEGGRDGSDEEVILETDWDPVQWTY